MNSQEFEDMFDSPKRLKTLDAPKHLLRYLAGELFVLACLCGIMWYAFK